MQAARGIADPAEELALDPRVDVLVVAVDFEAPFLDLGQHPGESGKDRTRVVRREDTGLPEHPGVREASHEVVAEQAAVERERGREAVKVRIELVLEHPAPELALRGRGRRGGLVRHSLATGSGVGAGEAVSRRTAATTRVGSAQRLLNPAASFWS